MKVEAIPTCVCDKCSSTKPSYVFTRVGEEKGGRARDLCGICFNREYTESAGVPDLEQAEFSPQSFYDSFGKEHVFHFAVRLSTGLGIRAFEWIDDGPGGYQFAVLEHPFTPVREVFAALLDVIKEGLAVHYMEATVFPNGQSKLYVKGSAVNGRIEELSDSEPRVVIDGVEYKWDDLGRALASCVGFNFRLQIFDPYAAIETTPDPERPDTLWWLSEEDGKPEPEDERSYS
jgi:hypothetical protein